MTVDFNSLESTSKGIIGVPGVIVNGLGGPGVAESGPGSAVHPAGFLTGDEGAFLPFHSRHIIEPVASRALHAW